MINRAVYYFQRVDTLWWIILAAGFALSVNHYRQKYILDKKNIFEALAGITWWTYMLFLMIFTVFIRLPNNEYSAYLVPFWSYVELIHTHNTELLFEIIGNILIFIPFGFLLPICGIKGKKELWVTILTGFIFSLSLEILQFITKLGTFEFDDIFNNLLGVIIGSVFIGSVRNIMLFVIKKREKKK